MHADNAFYCSRAATYAIGVAQRTGDDGLARAAQVIRDAADAHAAPAMTAVAQRAADTAQLRAVKLDVEYSASRSRGLLKGVLRSCADKL